MQYLSIFIRVTLLALGQSLNCHSASEVSLMNMGKSVNVIPQQSTWKQKPCAYFLGYTVVPCKLWDSRDLLQYIPKLLMSFCETSICIYNQISLRFISRVLLTIFRHSFTQCLGTLQRSPCLNYSKPNSLTLLCALSWLALFSSGEPQWILSRYLLRSRCMYIEC